MGGAVELLLKMGDCSELLSCVSTVRLALRANEIEVTCVRPSGPPGGAAAGVVLVVPPLVDAALLFDEAPAAGSGG